MVPEGLIKLMRKDPMFDSDEIKTMPDGGWDEEYIKSFFWSNFMTLLNNQALKLYNSYFNISHMSIYKCIDIYSYCSRLKEEGLVLCEEFSFYHSVIILDYITNKSITLYPQPHTIAYQMDLSTFVKTHFPSLVNPIIKSRDNIGVGFQTISFESCFKSWVTDLLDPGIVTRLIINQITKENNLCLITYRNNSYKLSKVQEQVIINFISHRITHNGQLDEIDSSLLVAYINKEIYYLP